MSSAVYFLDAQQAELYALASMDLALQQDKGLDCLPICYYHADEMFESDALNCVWLPLDKVYDFFQYSNLPLPEKIEYSGKLQFLETDPEFNTEFNSMLQTLKQRRNQWLILYRASPLDRDALFFDAQIALLTAIRNAPVMRNGQRLVQRCYYLGKKLSINLDNLIHVDLDHYVSFFASSIYPSPKIVVPNIAMNLEEMKEIEILFKNLNQLVAKHKCVG